MHVCQRGLQCDSDSWSRLRGEGSPFLTEADSSGKVVGFLRGWAEPVVTCFLPGA